MALIIKSSIVVFRESMLNKNVLLFLCAISISQSLFCVFTPEQLLQMHDDELEEKRLEKESFEKYLLELKERELKKKEDADRMLGGLKTFLIACAIDLIRSYMCDYAASYIPAHTTVIDTDMITVSMRTATRIGLEAATTIGIQAYLTDSFTQQSCASGISAATRLSIARYALPKTFQAGFFLATMYQDGRIPLHESACFENNAAHATYLASRCWNFYCVYKLIHARKNATA